MDNAMTVDTRRKARAFGGAAAALGCLLLFDGTVWAQGDITMMFLGNMGFKFMSPGGKIILTDPWLKGNADAPISMDDVDKADLILVSGAHADNLGDAVELGKKTGATVIATAELAAWMVSQGLDAKQTFGMMQGGVYRRDGLSVKVVRAVHTAGITIPGQPTRGYGGESIGFIVTFENDLRLYFSGDTALFGDMQLFGSLYKPHVAILSTWGRFMMEPEDGALAAKFLMTDNPNLRTIIPAHHRIKQPVPGATGTPEKVETEVKRLGLPMSVLNAVPGQTYTLTK